ncbi:MAG: IS66 family insertion sequence element accessory protein TnpB [Myxococcaceae bacterium]|nr:IS66 family insertion sequence element accessory protein TnpB [Myxococcaceae bacterium]MCI0669624.1 IS66 family insertion sequence element accessory protein TnpB [Myxococcaceae bacterium]
MIQITPQMRVLVAVEPADFRRGMDGLAQQCRAALGEDPFTGALFVFCNRQRTAVKLLVYDGQGFWLCHKRLSQGRFRWWPSSTDASARLQAHELQVLLCGGDPTATRAAPIWRRVAG